MSICFALSRDDFLVGQRARARQVRFGPEVGARERADPRSALRLTRNHSLTLGSTGSESLRPDRKGGLGVWIGLYLCLVSASAAERPFTNPFGLQLRPPPATVAEVRAPAILHEAPTNETSLVRRADGTIELYAIAKPASDAVAVMRSRDGGLTWSAAETAFPLPGKAYYAIQVLEAADGALHAVVHILGEGPGGYRGRLYEVYHAWKDAGAVAWTPPRKVVPGYVGSIRGFTALRSGRIVLAVARAVTEREQAPAAGPDRGWNDTYVYFTDDAGATWTQSPDVLSLELAGKNVTRYGAIEPVLLERRDHVWMLVRDRGGRLWESRSPDGARWAGLTRTELVSSDSPAGLLRLRDGRIVLFVNACQNWSNPRSYAMGGREVLQAAISRDEGATWRGFREVLHETLGTGRGDRGTAYPSAVENAAGKIVFASGQGEGKRAIVMFDPAWLEEQEVRDDLSCGPVGWTQYGSDGLRVEPREGGGRALVIPVTAEAGGGALWSFPSAVSGEIVLQVQAPAGGSAVRLVLTDHFNRIDDGKAAANAVFAVDLGGSLASRPAGWVKVQVAWRDTTQGGVATVSIDGVAVGTTPAQRAAPWGVNYLRLEVARGASGEALRVADVEARRNE